MSLFWKKKKELLKLSKDLTWGKRIYILLLFFCISWFSFSTKINQIYVILDNKQIWLRIRFENLFRVDPCWISKADLLILIYFEKFCSSFKRISNVTCCSLLTDIDSIAHRRTTNENRTDSICHRNFPLSLFQSCLFIWS